MNIENVQMLNETLDILHKGFYLIKGKEIRLKLTTEEMETAHVLLPQDVQKIRDNLSGQRHNSLPCCEYTCVNRDSFFSAIELSKEASFLSERRQEEKPILVLNFANPVNPGGGVRRGRERRRRISAEKVRCCYHWKAQMQQNTMHTTEVCIPSWAHMPSFLPRSLKSFEMKTGV